MELSADFDAGVAFNFAGSTIDNIALRTGSRQDAAGMWERVGKAWLKVIV
jgi:hypothetical protein